LLIISTIPGEGKSTVFANLAVTAGTQEATKHSAGRRRSARPVLAHEFGLGDHAGPSECLRGKRITNSSPLEAAFFRPLAPGEFHLSGISSSSLLS